MRSGLLSRFAGFACRTQSSRWVIAAAVGGSIFSPVIAQEVRPVDPHTIQLYSRSPAGTTATPERYQRTGVTPAPVKNYYTELFGDQSQEYTLTPVKSASLVQPIPTEAATAQKPQSNILHAQYEYEPTATQEFRVTPVSGTVSQQSSTPELPEWARNAKARTVSLQKPVQPEPEAAPAAPEMPTVAPTAVLRIDQPVEEPAVSTNAPVTRISDAAEGPQTPSVKVQWQSPEGINVGQQSTCELVVENVGQSTAYNVSVNTQFPESVELVDTTAEVTPGSGQLQWTLGNMAPGQTETIRIEVVPTQRGALNATAEVHFAAATQSAFVVREPLLGLKMDGPTEVLLGDPASQSVTITNPGNGIAKNVKLEALIPDGLEHPRGKRLLMDVGSLNPGEARSIRLALAATTGGTKLIQVSATAESGLLATSESTINIIAPSLAAEISGPGLRYKNRSATYTLKVANDGTVSTSNVRLMHKIPEGFEFLSASRGATYDAPTRILSWFVGNLQPGKVAEMEVELNAVRIGEFTHFIRATSEHGSTTDTQIVTRVEGASALVLKIFDMDDPIEIGNQTSYEVRVMNEGSAAAEDVGVTCELPEGVEFVSASGPSEFVVDGNLILFKPLEGVPAGQSASFKIHVVGKTEGNHKFRARMTSATSPEPLTFEELTRFYGDTN
ncbi:hypothetical protein [Rubinisphaera margarita]|uniref:hypothetical protein n=1 Tax=Rubinisphaera margarita TaxID=2909586 RepID=UPI001EE8B181|nr:hypothetical protein [Rubinisphaera margarita]MCG6157471.1 hypothetical protein [Rubinisphaera margarita]